MTWLSRLADLLGDDRFMSRAAALQNEGVLILLYAGGFTLFTLSMLTFAAAFWTMARRCAHGTRQCNGAPCFAIMSGETLKLYAFASVFLMILGLSSLLTLYVAVWRLDLLILAATSSVAAVAASYTAWATWGPEGNGHFKVDSA